MVHIKSYVTLVLTACICWGFWSCREKPLPENTIAVEPASIKPVPKVIDELSSFGGVSLTEYADLDSLLVFKLIDSSGALQEIDVEKSARLFKKLKSGKKVSGLPIIEFKETNKTLVMFQGRGYGGPIWATLIFDNSTLKIEKVAFDHRAESEGYGAAMTMSAFENQFLGMAIEDSDTNFGINQGGKNLLEGSHNVDGISGATQTSMAVIRMMNEGASDVKRNAFKSKIQ